MHEERLREYEKELARSLPQGPSRVRLSLESGVGHEREWVRFWRRLLSSVER